MKKTKHGIDFGPYFYKAAERAGRSWALSSKYLKLLLLNALIEALDLRLEELGKLHAFGFQCRSQKSIFNRERLWMHKDTFDLEGEHMLMVGTSSVNSDKLQSLFHFIKETLWWDSKDRLMCILR